MKPTVLFSCRAAPASLLSALCLLAAPVPLSQAAATPDPRVREYVAPTRIVWQSAGEGGSVQDAQRLLEPFSGQITLDNRAGCVLRHRGQPPGLLLDFGRELHGGVQIAVADLKNATPESKTVRVRLRFGESVAEAMSDLGGEKNATNDHAVRDDEIRLPWLGTAEFGNTGFRFVRLDLVEPDTTLTLKAVRAVYLHRGLPRLGSFRCNDERLNRIWDTGAYTVYLNLQDYVWDGIKRDRLVWIGDMHPETSTIGAVFGPVRVVNASLDLIRDDTPLPKWMNGISSYSLWWVLIQRDWYRQTGDLDYLRQQQPYLAGLLRALARHIGPDGAETLPEMRFLDWPSSENKQAIHAGLQSLMVMAFEAGAEMARALEDKTTAAQSAQALARLRQHAPDPGGSKQAAALLALAGLRDAAALNRDVLARNGAHGLSTFYGYYVLQARAKAGDVQGALDNIRQFWGAMLDLGATTFWEDFNLEWTENAARIDELVPPGKKDIHGDFGAYCYKGFRHSLCHGWASGPTAWLSEHVLGVKIVEPGCRTVRIAPRLGDLQWVEGTYPTPRGLIKIRHERLPDGRIKSDLQAPEGVQILRE
ncbi:MAG TPA: alpha-L-rhamnosidase C-terminal domain-containing protein [Verrucomicrobiota bacterium]|nr:alpha-L-rhamnosidase C-terminal domain-containing protein [Verrucomicrobiota bacterium]HRT58627.1 alpha-L-rhamnosidase C-terminal domain-containing protein [Candidatus Paceibacterota bacterium]